MIYSAFEQETLQRSRMIIIDSNIQFRSHEKFHTNDDLLRAIEQEMLQSSANNVVIISSNRNKSIQTVHFGTTSSVKQKKRRQSPTKPTLPRDVSSLLCKVIYYVAWECAGSNIKRHGILQKTRVVFRF